MPRPKRTIRPTYLNLAIPEDVRVLLDLRLYSELEGRVPHGAYSEYVCRLIRADILPPEPPQSDLDLKES